MKPDKFVYAVQAAATGGRDGRARASAGKVDVRPARNGQRFTALLAAVGATATMLGGLLASSTSVGQTRSTTAGMRVGEVLILPVYDGVGRVRARDTIRRTSVRGDPWGPHQDLLLPGGILEYPMGGFLVLDGDRRILVDAGNGPSASRDESTGEFLRSLDALGYSPSDITDVLFTHLHSDHTGWAVRNGRPEFPNAIYRVHEADWRLYGGAFSSLSALTRQLQVFSADTRISPSITTRHLPGHTPGTAVFVVSSGNERALLIGDIAHSPAQFADRDWYTVWDSDRAEATRARNTIADEAAATGELIIPAHFPGMGGGHILDGPRRFVLSEQQPRPR